MNITNKDFLKDEVWKEVLSFENLLSAWAKVRNALGFEMLEDTMEIRLYEFNLTTNLEYLRENIISYNWGVLGVSDPINYEYPKGVGKSARPLSICKLEDQIIAAAILQTQKEYKELSENFFAYRLKDTNKGESLYVDWFISYQSFVDKARETSINNPKYSVIQTDLTSYYPSINQRELFGRLDHLTYSNSSRLSDILNSLIIRESFGGKEGFGIPQGHIFSGALSNIYLLPIDLFFGPRNKYGIYFFRFVDDMILIFPPNISEQEVLNLLDGKLNELGLSRSVKKTTKKMDTKEFTAWILPDTRLNQLSKDFNYLLSDIYKLQRSYLNILNRDWWLFISIYQNLLFSINIFFNKALLSRKLNKYRYWWNRFSIPSVNSPVITEDKDLLDEEWWKEEFYKLNTYLGGWLERRTAIVITLKELFLTSLEIIESEASTDFELLTAKRHLKFAINHLGRLGFEELTDTVVVILREKPWLVNVRRTVEDLALQKKEVELVNLLVHLIDKHDAECAYLRAIVLKALRKIPNLSAECVDILQKTALQGETTVERLMASETIFLSRNDLSCTKSELHRRLVRSKEKPYLLRNYLLLYSAASGRKEAPAYFELKLDILINLVQLRKCPGAFDSLYQEEPEILRVNFYENNYPDDSSEFADFPSGML